MTHATLPTSFRTWPKSWLDAALKAGVAYRREDDGRIIVCGVDDILEKFAIEIQQATVKSIWDEINAAIKSGPLQGNGCDETAQRNGLVLASNIVHEWLSENNSQLRDSQQSGT